MAEGSRPTALQDAKELSSELDEISTPRNDHTHKNDLERVQSDNNNDYILGSINFQNLDSSDMGYRDREFIIINVDDDPRQTLGYLTERWNLGAPKLVISLIGGFKVIKGATSNVKKQFRRELVNAVLSTGAWVTTCGLHAGVVKDFGETLRHYAIGHAIAEHVDVVVIGIAPLSILEHKHQLIAGQTSTQYKIDPNDVTIAQLDPNHSHFILVNDEESDSGAEVEAQCKLLKEISGRKISGSTASVPVVCIVIGGGYKRIRAVHQSVVNNDIPVIIMEGSGGAADVLAYACNQMSSKNRTSRSLSRNAAETMNILNSKLRSEFGSKIESMHGELLDYCREIAEKESLVTVLSLNVSQGGNGKSNVEETILNAILKAKSGNHSGDQLHLAAVLNRLDLAEELLRESRLKVTEVRESLRFALVNNQVKFVQLFLNKGFYLHEYLTVKELTRLYKMVKNDTLLYGLLDVEMENRGESTVLRNMTLKDVGNVIKKLTTWSYQPLYLRKEFEGFPSDRFQNPSRELFIWAVLQGRLEMANLFWREGKASIGGALVASKLLKEIASRSREHELHESRGMAKYEKGWRLYEQLAVGVLDECYLCDRIRTSLIIVRSLPMWGNVTCLDLANGADNIKFIAHPAVQNMLKEFWMGKLSLDNPRLKIGLCVVFPPALFLIHLKLKEEDVDPLLVKSLPRGRSKGTILVRKRLRQKVVSKARRWRPISEQLGLSKKENEHTPHPREFGANFTGLPLVELNRRKAVKVDEEDKNKHRVSLTRRIKYFFLVPKVIFAYNVMSTVAFLVLFSYILLKGFKTMHPDLIEYVLLLWFITMCTEIMRQILTEDAENLTHRMVEWISNFWNKIDICKSIAFIVGYVMRCYPQTMDSGRIVLAISLIVFYMRLLHIFTANKHLGPKLVMIQKMIGDLLVFICILLVFMVAYGVSSEAVLHPKGRENITMVLESIFYRPYIQMFGEWLLTDADNSDCMEDDCLDNLWFGTILLSVYLFLSNVLLLNLLIAMFNYTFTAVQENTDVYWKFQRYELIKEYYKRPPLPPPFIIICHAYLFIVSVMRSIFKVCMRCRKSVCCSCGQPTRQSQPSLSLTQATVNETSIWESVKGEDFLAKERDKEEHHINKNTDQRIHELSAQVTSIAEQLENIQSILLEKLGPSSEDAIESTSDAPTLDSYKKSGRRSSRLITAKPST